MATPAPHGSWRSPIGPASLVQHAVRLSSVAVDGDDVYWNEGRPAEAGRQVVVRRRPDGSVEDAVPAGASARTLAHEYGGRSFDVRDGVLVFSDFGDQGLHRGDGTPIAAEAGAGTSSVRYADHEISPDGRWVLCVRERHPEGGGPADVVNDLVAVSLDPSPGAVVELAGGHDFFAAPRLSPDGTRLAWISWDHPDMPWDSTELSVADVGPGMELGEPRVVAGGPGVSVVQPAWSPAGVLHWASDESGWWNLYAEGGRRLVDRDAEFAVPQWQFGPSSYAVLDDGTLVATWTSAGFDHLGVVRDGDVEEIATPFSSIRSVVAVPGGVACIAASARRAPAVVRVDVPGGGVTVLRESQGALVDDEWIAEPRPVEFPTTGDRTAHALFYAPRNPDFEAPAGERPPLIVLSHGGPTSHTSAILDLGIQFWTTRGIAVVDVDYGGSTGYGRAYRERLRGAWGIVDVDDCVAAARWLADQGEVDGRRLVIRGGSAGGWTTLCALTFRPGVFACGSSHFGVADAEALARDTHKFESRYLDGLIGPHPDDAATYRERSPIHHTERLSCPIILFQGLEDVVVPPAQSSAMAGALDAKGIPHAYVAFEGEQHGFRRAETIERVAEAELSFLGRVLGFTPADDVAPVPIEHEAALGR